MKKLLSLTALIFVITLSSSVIEVTYAQSTDSGSTPSTAPAVSTNPFASFDDILSKSKLTNFAGRFHRLSNVAPGADAITSIVFFTLDFLKYLLGGVAILYIIIAGFRLITAANKIDEVAEKNKENIKYIIYGLLLVIMADQLVMKVFFGEYGECIASASNAKACAEVGGSLIKGVYSFILTIIATIALFMLSLSSFRLITAYGEEDVITKQKKNITMALVGLIVAGLGEFVVKGIIFPKAGAEGINIAEAQKLVYNVTNFISAFIAAGAFIMLFYAGYLYVTSAGSEDQTGKAKKIITAAIIGIIIALAAFGVVTTISTFSPSVSTINLPKTLP